MAIQMQGRVELLIGYVLLALLVAFVAFLIYEGITIF